MPSAPNLFDWATSELSQDAFLCWLVAHAGDTERLDLQRVARAFIAWLWSRRSKPTTLCDPDDVSLCSAPVKQQGHTDVFFSARIGGAVVPFLVEDKVHTSHHSGQLTRYAKWVEQQKQRYGLAADLKVYFKTGYHFDEDRAAEKHGYTIVGLEDIVEFFGQHIAASEILRDYRRYVTTMLDERRHALEGYRQLGRDFVQYEFMRALKERCPEHVAAGEISHDTNLGGAPWTHYHIATFPKALAGVNEVIFLRIDARQNEYGKRCHYLGLRQFGRVKPREKGRIASEPKLTKLARLAKHRPLFVEACAEAKTTLRFSKPSNDFQGANESEIGLLFFDSKEQAPAVVLEQWPLVHRALIKRLSAMSVAPP